MLEEYDIDKLNPRINPYVNNGGDGEYLVADDREYSYHGPVPEDISNEEKEELHKEIIEKYELEK